jgi:protein-tyrosine kinase
MSMSRQTNETMLITEINPMSTVSEAYRALRTNTHFAAVDKPAKILCVTSCQEGEGKTTTCANLAITYAQEGKRTLLIDADLRRSNLHQAFVITNRLGLTHYLVNKQSLSDVAIATHVEHLWLLPSGPTPPNPAELLSSNKMDELLREAVEKFDVIIIDTPPILVVTDAQIIAAKCEGVLLVIRSGKIKRGALLKAKTKLEHVKARILGVVLNGKKKSSNHTNYYGYAID